MKNHFKYERIWMMFAVATELCKGAAAKPDAKPAAKAIAAPASRRK